MWWIEKYPYILYFSLHKYLIPSLAETPYYKGD